MGCQQLSNSWSLVAQAVLQLTVAIPLPLVPIFACWNSGQPLLEPHQSLRAPSSPWLHRRAPHGSQAALSFLDVVLFSGNPHWQIPTTYLLSHGQILTLGAFEDRHKIVLCTVPGDLPQLQPLKGSSLRLASSTSGTQQDLALGIQHSTLSTQMNMNMTQNQI